MLTSQESFIYEADLPPDRKFQKIGRRLASFGDLFRHAEHAAGLILVVPGTHPRQRDVTTTSELQAVINDRLVITVVKDGKAKGGRIPAAELASMLKSEVFLQAFRPLDRMVDRPLYLPNWKPTAPGYNDGGWGQRYYFAGREAAAADRPDAINKFLAAMPFKSEADRTNTVAAALTVQLRNRWPGKKPMFTITANKSHAGKGTIVAFAAGDNVPEQVSFDPTDWAFEKNVVMLFQLRPALAVLNVDNIRLDRRGEVVRSAFLERILHEAEPVLGAPGVRKPLRTHAHFVVMATANDGRFSQDLLNRAVAIRLEATGDVTRRASPIGDPKNEFLPQHRDRIVAELHGMIERWLAAGRPPDERARHPSFGDWARTVGGILAVNGYAGFLENQAERRTDDDPVRRALAVLGRTYPDEWAPSADWAARIAQLGLTKVVIPAADQDTPEGRVRGTGVVLTNHLDEVLSAATEDGVWTLALRRARRRFDGEPQTRYRFDLVDHQAVPEDGEA